MPRHRTMQAVVDWSYDLLSDNDQRFFRGLGIFAGGFTCEATASVAWGSDDRPTPMRSTASPISWRNRWSWRMLATPGRGSGCSIRPVTSRSRSLTRSASAKRSRSATPNITAISSRALKGVTVARPPVGWLAASGQEIDNVRAALAWSFSSPVHASIGTELAAAYVPVWLNMSLAAECRAAQCGECSVHSSRPNKFRMPGCGCGSRSVSATACFTPLGPAEQAQKLF